MPEIKPELQALMVREMLNSIDHIRNYLQNRWFFDSPAPTRKTRSASQAGYHSLEEAGYKGALDPLMGPSSGALLRHELVF